MTGHIDHDVTSEKDAPSRPSPRPRLNAALAAEVRDALCRRPREVPARFLLDDAIAPVRRQLEQLEAPHFLMAESPLLRHWAEEYYPERPVRRVVELLPTASAGVSEILDAPSVRGALEAYAAVEIAVAPVREAIERVRSRRPKISTSYLVVDPTMGIPLPRAGTTLFTCLGGTIGRYTPVGVVRTLRSVRAIMSLSDLMVIGLDLRAGESDPDSVEPSGHREQLHRHALVALNRDFGTDFEPSRFRHRIRYDTDNRRVEAGLECTSACRVTTPIMDPMCLKAGEFIRTGVRCVYDRATFSSMLRGVGLSLDAWLAHPSGAHALAIASIGAFDVQP